MLAQLLTGKPLASSRQVADEAVIKAPNKTALDNKIAAQTRVGWRLRFRAHSSEGEHSATMFRLAE